jgi:4-amino-4-deoxy-L-arabinose transferase-like glycosyltransferase
VTLDKLPGSFWVQALVVRAFGLSTVSLVVPQIIAGVLTVVMMFVAVRRIAGARAGVVASAVTAAVPATAIMSRGNTADAICVLLMVVAADAALRAIQNGRLRTVILAGVFVGLAFQAKMLEAWAILPALGLAYVVAAPDGLRRRLGKAAVGGVVAVAVSLSWMTAVSLVPAVDRPYVDGSRHDSVYEQVFQYNGVERFGASPGFGLGGNREVQATTPLPANVEAAIQRAGDGPSADRSTPGVTRLVSGQVGRDAGWLLPLALVAMVGVLVARRRRPRTDLVRAGVLLWGTWLVTFTVLFSGASELLTYYTGALVPPIAALVAIGLRTLYRTIATRDAARDDETVPPAMPAIGIVALAVGAASLAVLAWRTPTWFVALAIAVVAVMAALGAALPGSVSRRFAAASLVLLVGPVAATVALVADGGGSFDAPLTRTLANPAPRPPGSVGAYAGVVVPTMGVAQWQELDLLRHSYAAPLSADRRLAIFTSAEASEFVLAGVPDVEPIGGYTGLVDVPTAAEVRAQVSRGEIAYAIVPPAASPWADDSRIAVITQSCQPINPAAGAVAALRARLFVCPQSSGAVPGTGP